MNRTANSLKTAVAIALTSVALGAFAQDATTTTSKTHKSETTVAGGSDVAAKTRVKARAVKRNVRADAKAVSSKVKAETTKTDATVSTTTSTTDVVKPGTAVSSSTKTTTK